VNLGVLGLVLDQRLQTACRCPSLAGRGLARNSLVGYRAGPLLGIDYMCEEAPVFTARTSVGLDVYARSVVAAAIDGDTGEVLRVSRSSSA